MKLVVQLGRRTIDGGTQEEENKASNLMLHPIYRLNGCGDCVKDDSTVESYEHCIRIHQPPVSTSVETCTGHQSHH